MISYNLNIFSKKDKWIEFIDSDLFNNIHYKQLEDFFDTLALLDQSGYNYNELIESEYILSRSNASYLPSILNDIIDYLNQLIKKIDDENKSLVSEDIASIDELINNSQKLKFIDFIYEESYCNNKDVSSVLKDIKSITNIKLTEANNPNFLDRLDNLEKRYILYALSQCYIKAKVARLLGITVGTLYDKIEKYGLDSKIGADNKNPNIMSLAIVEKEHIKKMIEKYSRNKRDIANALGISEKTLYNKLYEYDIMFPDDRSL